VAVSRLAVGTGGSNNGLSALTISGPNIAVADPYTCVIAIANVSVSSNSTATTLSATYNGVAMTQIGSILLGGSTTSRAGIAAFVIFNPPTGVKNIVITPGGASTKAQIRANAVAFGDVDNTATLTLQTATATTHAPTSVANGYVIRGLSNGATLSSPNQTQEELSGNTAVGGVGDYICIQSAAGTGSTVSFTCSGTATTPLSVAVSLPPKVPLTGSLSNDFSSSTGLTLDAGVTVSGGTLNIAATTTSRTATVSGFPHRVKNSYVSCELAQYADDAGGSNWIELYIQSTADGADHWAFSLVDSQLTFRETVNNVANNVAVTYDSTAHRWWRFRIGNGTSGKGTQAIWETSPNGIDWTVRRSKVIGAVDPLAVKIWWAATSNGTTPGTVKIDNFNLASPLSAAAIASDFTTKDTSKFTFNGISDVANGQLVAPDRYNWPDNVISKQTGDLTEASVYVQAVDVPVVASNNAGMTLRVRSRENTSTYIDVTWFYDGLLYMQNTVNGSSFNRATPTYDPKVHKWWRIRLSGDTIYWDTSVDGLTWTNRATNVNGSAPSMDLVNVDIQIYAGYGALPDSGQLGTGHFDNLNLPLANPKTSTLTEDWTTQDTAKWGNWSARTVVSGGQLRMTPASSASQAYIESVGRYDLTASSFYFNLASYTDDAGVTNAIEVGAYDPVAGYVSIGVKDGNLFFDQHNGTSVSETTIAYNSTNHKWLRISESGGNLLWDTSPDGTAGSWTNQRTQAKDAAWGINEVIVWISASSSATAGTAATQIFDNFNVVPPSGASGTSAASLAKAVAAATGTQTQTGTSASAVARLGASANGQMEPSGVAVAVLRTPTSAATGAQAQLGTSAATVRQPNAAANGAQLQTGTSAAAVAKLVASAAGQMEPSGTSAAALRALTAAASGLQTQVGTSAAALRALVAAASGVMAPSGASDTALRALTAAATGAQAYLGTSAVALQAIVASAVGAEAPAGTSVAVLRVLTAAAVGAQTQQGTSAATLAKMVAAASGVMAPSGASDAALRPLAAAAAGAQLLTGSAAAVLAALTASATGAMAPSGASAVSLQVLVAAASGAQVYVGDSAVTLQAVSASAAGLMMPSGVSDAVLRPLVSLALGQSFGQGGSDVFLRPLTAVAGGAQQLSGTSASKLAALVASSTGAQIIAGAAATVLAVLTASAAGEQKLSGASAATVAKLTAAASGAQNQAGAAAAALRAMTAAASGALFVNVAAATVARVVASAIGAQPFTGVSGATIQRLAAAAVGAQPYSSAASAALSALVAQGTGAVMGSEYSAVRMLIVAAEDRTLVVATALRTLEVIPDNRTIDVATEDRTITWPAQNREVEPLPEQREIIVGAMHDELDITSENRTVDIAADDRTMTITGEDRTLYIPAENREVVWAPVPELMVDP